MIESTQPGPDVVRACHAKARYPTEAVANTVAADCYRRRGTWLRVYACVDGCGGYHLTKTRARPPLNVNWAPPAVSQREQARRDRNNRKRRKGRR